MAQDVTYYGSWTQVPYVDLPKTGGGDAVFTDVSDTTAIAADVSSTKYFYTANGTRVKGTSAGGTALQEKTVTPSDSQIIVTPDTNYDGLSQVTINAISPSYIGSGINRNTAADLTVSGSSVNVPAGYYASAANKSVATATQATPTISISVGGLITSTVTQEAGYVANGITSSSFQLPTQPSATITPTTSTQTIVTSGKYTTGTITVAAIPTEYIVPTGTITISSNGTGIDIAQYASANVSVNAPAINLENKTITPSETKQTITAGSGYDGLGTVTVNAITASYVGSEVTRRSSSDMTMSGATVTAPAGYYASAASKTITSMTLPTTVATTSSGTTKATISRSTSDQYINIPTGYNGTAANYKISAVTNGSATPTATLGGTSAELTTGTNTLTLTKTISNTPIVSAGYVSAGTAGNTKVTLTASVTTKAAATITPGTSNQTIAAGTYLTGAQTIAGDADLVASNIINGVQIFGVTGNVVLQNYYTGTSTPSSSLGSNGDIYIQQ